MSACWLCRWLSQWNRKCRWGEAAVQECVYVCVRACALQRVCLSENADRFEWYCVFMHFNKTVCFLFFFPFVSHNCTTRWHPRGRPHPHSRNAGNSISVSQHSDKIFGATKRAHAPQQMYYMGSYCWNQTSTEVKGQSVARPPPAHTHLLNSTWGLLLWHTKVCTDMNIHLAATWITRVSRVARWWSLLPTACLPCS